MSQKTLTVVLAGDERGARKALQDLDKDADQLEGRFAKLGSKISPGMVAAAGAVAGGVALLAKGAYDAAAESAKIGRESERVIKTTGASAWTSADQVGRLAGSISELSGADDELVQSGANLLLTFTNVQNKAGEGNRIFDRGTQAALDMSAALGTEMSGAAMLVGKALNDPIKGMTALTRSGVSFTQQQKDQVRALVETGDVLGAQRIILDELEKEFAGAAAAAATPADRLRVKIGNLQEDIGGKLIPLVDTLATGGEHLVRILSAIPDPVANVGLAIGGLVTVGGAGVIAVAKIAEVGAPAFAAVKSSVDSAGLGVASFANKLGVSQDRALSLGQNLGQALGAAGVLVGGAIAAWTIWNAKIDETKDDVESLTGKVKDKAGNMTLAETADYLGKVRGQVEELDSSIRNSSAPWDADYRAQLRHGRDELGSTADAIQANVDKAYALSAASGISADQVYRWVQTEEAAGRTYSSNEAALAALTISTQGYAGSAQDAANAAASQAENIDAAREAMLATTDPYFAATRALGSMKEAQDAYNLAVFLHGERSPEAVRAWEAMAQAGLGYKGSLLQLSSAQAAGDASAEGLASQLESLRQFGLDPTSTAAQIATWNMGVLGGVADEVGRKAVHIPVSADTSAAHAAIDGVLARLRAVWREAGNAGPPPSERAGYNGPTPGTVSLDGKLVAGYDGKWYPTGYAAGGSVGDGWFMTGEKGPELGYKSGSSVEIFSNPKTEKMLGGGMGSARPSVVLHLTVQGSVITENELVEVVRNGMIKAARHVNGYLPGFVVGP
jgi:hypothetical protein